MSLQVEKLENNMAKLTIEVPVEEVEKALESSYQKNKGKMSVPGFRKGKVPRPMIEKMYGKEVFYEDAVNALIPTAYEKAYEECEEEIVSAPEIDVVEFAEGKPFIFTAEVALKPAVKLGKYKGVKIDKIEIEVSEEEIDAQINRERENSARTISIDNRPVQDKDMTVIDFEGFVDGVAFEGGKGENYPLTIGSGAFIPGFEEQLVGVELGVEVEVNVTFPEEYQAEQLKGKAAVFKCTVKEIKEKELPALDDDFASEVSEFDTLKEYQEDVKQKIAERKEKDAKNAKEDAVIAAIIEDCAMEVPEAMIKSQQRQMAEEFVNRIRMQGLSIEQYFEFTGLNPEKFMEQMKPQAEKRIKSGLVLEAIAEAEKFEVSDEDYEKELERMASVYQMEIEKIKEMTGKNEEERIRKDIAITKAVEFVVAEAKEVKVKKAADK